MKYLSFLSFVVVLVFIQPSLVLAQSAPDEDSNQSEIEEEATELTDLTGGRQAYAQEQELQGVAPKHKRVQRHVAAASPVKSLQAEKASLLKSSQTRLAHFQARKIQAQKMHTIYQAQLTRVQREIAALKALIAKQESEAAIAEDVAAQDRVQLEKAQRTRDELSKMSRTARRLHVAYEDPLE